MYVIRTKNKYGTVYATLSADKTRLSSFGVSLEDAHVFKNTDEIAEMIDATRKILARMKVRWEVCLLGVTRVIGPAT